MLLWLKALHIIAVIAWMAGMLYLPRLFVYHADVPAGSPTSELFKVMEYRLYRYIVTPAMIAVWVTGPILLVGMGYERDKWAIAKVVLVVAMSAMHGFFGRWRRDFAHDRNTKSAKFFRMVNEVPTVLMVAIVVLVVAKPF